VSKLLSKDLTTWTGLPATCTLSALSGMPDRDFPKVPDHREPTGAPLVPGGTGRRSHPACTALAFSQLLPAV
jgi:hypothetical protein